MYLNDNYTTGIEDLIHYTVLNDINKAEIEYFLSKYLIRSTNADIKTGYRNIFNFEY